MTVYEKMASAIKSAVPKAEIAKRVQDRRDLGIQDCSSASRARPGGSAAGGGGRAMYATRGVSSASLYHLDAKLRVQMRVE